MHKRNSRIRSSKISASYLHHSYNHVDVKNFRENAIIILITHPETPKIDLILGHQWDLHKDVSQLSKLAFRKRNTRLFILLLEYKLPFLSLIDIICRVLWIISVAKLQFLLKYVIA